MPEQDSNINAALIRGLRTAIFTFFGTFLPAVMKWIGDVYEWANTRAGGAVVVFPKPTTLAFVAVAALCSAVSGLIGFLWNWLENSTGFALFGAKKDKLS